jgi:hypothetical protein
LFGSGQFDQAGCVVDRLAVPFHARKDTGALRALTIERT